MPRIVDHDARRDELARAGIELVASRGVAALSVRNLAAASGWSAGAVRHYLPTHADIVALVSDRVRSDFERRLEAVPESSDQVEMLRALLRAGLPLDAESQQLSRVWFAFLGAEMHQGSGASALVYAELFAALVGFFELMQQSGRLAVDSPVHAARTLQAQFDGVTVHLLSGHLQQGEALATLDQVLASLLTRG